MAFAVRLKPAQSSKSSLMFYRQGDSPLVISTDWTAELTSYYSADADFRYDLNRAYRAALIDITNAPSGFPDWTHLPLAVPLRLLAGPTNPTHDVVGGTAGQLYVNHSNGRVWQKTGATLFVDMGVNATMYP